MALTISDLKRAVIARDVELARLRAALLALVETADNAAMTHNIGTMDEAIDYARSVVSANAD
jgi:hypothetical protein